MSVARKRNIILPAQLVHDVLVLVHQQWFAASYLRYTPQPSGADGNVCLGQQLT